MRLLAYLRAFCLSLSLFLITVSSHECDPYQPLYTQISEDLEPWTSGRLTMPDQKDTVDLCKTKNNWSYICFQLGPDGLKITWIHDNAYGVNWHTLHTQGFFVELSEVFSRYGHELLQALDGSEFNFVLFMGDQNQESLQNLGWQPGLPPYGPNRGRRLPIILSYHRAEGMPLVLIPYSPWLRCNKKPTPLQNQSLNKGVVKAGLSSAYAFDNALLNDKDTPLSRTEWSLRKPVALGRQSLFCPKMKTMSSDGSRLLPCARKHLESLSQKHSDLLDFAFPGKPMEKERRQRLFVPAMNQSQWKYLVMTDGWTIRTRIETHMLTESVILWQDSPLFGYWFKSLKPWVHYVPFYSHENDILTRIRWLRNNDKEARKIGENGRKFVQTFLHRGARWCYYREVLMKIGEVFRKRVAAGKITRQRDRSREVSLNPLLSMDDILSKIKSSRPELNTWDCDLNGEVHAKSVAAEVYSDVEVP